MNEDLPLVSVLMTAFNREQFITDAIESVLANSYQNWELIIVDDCSKDNTVAIAKSYEQKDNRIRVYINERNLGDYPNRNRAASYAKGEYLVNVDSDDRMYPNVLFRWVKAMQKYKARFGIFAKTSNSEPIILSASQIIKKHFFENPVLSFGPAATITERTYFNEQKGFPMKYGPANDMYHNLKLASHTDTLIFNFPLINYRMHEGQELNNHYGYLYHNYNYLKDALCEIELPLTRSELRFLSDKNKRRFVVNAFGYLARTGKIMKTIRAFQLTKFTLKDFKTAIIH